jgi:hypothetical protein
MLQPSSRVATVDPSAKDVELPTAAKPSCFRFASGQPLSQSILHDSPEVLLCIQDSARLSESIRAPRELDPVQFSTGEVTEPGARALQTHGANLSMSARAVAGWTTSHKHLGQTCRQPWPLAFEEALFEEGCPIVEPMSELHNYFGGTYV